MQVKQSTIDKQSKLVNGHRGSRQSRKYSDVSESDLACKASKVCKQKAPRLSRAFPGIEIQKTDSDNQSAFSEFETQCSHQSNVSMRSPSLSSDHSGISFAPRCDETERKAQTQSQAKNGGNSLLQNLIATLADPADLVSTPDIHKFRTEMCKNFEHTGDCHFGDRCSFAHSKNQIMMKSNLPVNYKTKMCRKYQLNGYCPYGSRCQFKHGASDQRKARKFSEEIETSRACYFTEALKCNVEQAEFDRTPKYSEILIHCLNVSMQEQGKKVAIFEKKQENLASMSEPEYQYMNIYQSGTSRLGVFSSIALDSDSEEDDRHFGDAASYEQFLLRNQSQNIDQGYMSDPSPTKLFRSTDFSTLSVESSIFKPTI